MEMTFTMPDIGALVREMQAFPKVLRERAMKGAVATGASVIRKEAVLRAPIYTGKVQEGHPPPGTLKRSIYQTRLPELCSDSEEVWKVDVRRGASAVSRRGKNKGQRMLDKDAFYALWVEYGHYTRTPGTTAKEHRRLRSGVDLYTGSRWVPAKPFMRPAFESSKQRAHDAMAEYLRKRVAEIAVDFRFMKAMAA